MIVVTAAQYAVFAAMSEKRFVERLTLHLSGLGSDPLSAKSLAQHALSNGRARGLQSADEIEAFAEVLMAALPRQEPDWAREIVDRPGHMKANRLRACLTTVQRDWPHLK